MGENDLAEEDMPGRKAITAVAADFNLTLRTLRYYEQRGLLRPMRVGTSRWYDAHDEHTLRLIQQGKGLGFTLLEIEAVLKQPEYRESDSPDFVWRLSKKLIEAQLQTLQEEQNALTLAIEELKRSLAALDGGDAAP